MGEIEPTDIGVQSALKYFFNVALILGAYDRGDYADAPSERGHLVSREYLRRNRMSSVNIPRRNFLNLLGGGASLVAGATVASLPALAGGPDDRDRPVPELGDRTQTDSQVIKDRPGIVITDWMISGGSGLKLVRCPGAVIENLDISQSSFSGLWLEDCPGALVSGGFFHDNGRHRKGSPSGRVGHGIHLSRNCNEILIEGAEAFGNFEDGAQQARNCTGRVTYRNVVFHHNMENGLDAKGGFVRLENPSMHDNGDGRGMEAVILHKNCAGFECYDGSLIVREGENNTACINAANGPGVRIERTTLDASAAESQPIEGTGKITLIEAILIAKNRPLVKVDTPCDVLLDRCVLSKPGTKSWYRVDDTLYEMALDLDVPNLRVVSANHREMKSDTQKPKIQ